MIKKLTFFLLIFFALFLLSLPACKKDCSPDPPPDSIPDTSDTSVCNPIYHNLTSNELSYYDFLLLGNLDIYYKTNTTINLYTQPGYLLDTIKYCNEAWQYYSSAYITSGNISRINYLLNVYDEAHYPENFIITIGPGGQLGCQSIFEISTGEDTANVDSIQLLGKTFYDVYYRTDDVGCAFEMYYNKLYGVVGFNWLGEWYVLETDSL